jgi:xanthine dehydrogenase YagS FAD-binding subunit
MVVQNARGERVVDAVDYFIGPEVDITRMTVLEPGELLTAIRIPSTWAGAQFYFEKVRDRNVWDFPLLNVASAATYENQTIQRIRIVINAAAARPLRLRAVEEAIVGKPRNEQTAELAGQIAVQGAQALRYNAYKIPLMRNLVKRAIRGGSRWTS